jgi:phage tail-like protein
VAELFLQTFRFEVSLVRSSAGGPASRDTVSSKQDPGSQRLCAGGFQECTGLELEADVREHLEGGRNDGIVRRVGRVKLVPLVLKRGMVLAPPAPPTPPAAPAPPAPAAPPAGFELWAWFQGMVTGRLPLPRYDGIVEVKGAAAGSPTLVTWKFTRGLPLKVVGPTLNAKTGEIAIEELHIVHEGLHLVWKEDP